MKHKKIDGRLLNMDKNFSHLKQKQKEKISEWLYSATYAFYEANGEVPYKKHISEIVDEVYEKINDAEIWIPYYEVKKFYISRLKRYEKRILKAEKCDDS